MSFVMPRPSSLREVTTPVFFDHAAGSPLRSDVALAMAEGLRGLPPNPSGSHSLARATRGVLEDARERIAAVLGVEAREIVFTGGGTESCNLALLGVMGPSAICISTVEHTAVRQAALEAASLHGVPLVELPVDSNGVLLVEKALELIPDGALVSVMTANNETGVMQPITQLRKALRHAPRNIILHSDAIAAAPSSDVKEIVLACDLVSLAGHKLGGPPGTGVLVVKEGLRLKARNVGGGQELDRRAGTQDVAGALGMAVSLELAQRDRESGAVDALKQRRDQLEQSLAGAHPTLSVTAQRVPRLAGHLHLTVRDCRSEELLMLLDQEGICASAGAACASGAPQASHVLLAMGVDADVARGALRLTLSTSTTDEEVAVAERALTQVLSKLS